MTPQKTSPYGIGDIVPLRGYCIVKPHAQMKAQEGGIWLPQKALDEMGSTGTVIRSNPDTFQYALEAGDRIIMRRGFGRAFHVNGEAYITFPIAQVLAITTGSVVVEQDAVARCRYCKSTGEGNILMANGKCPTCGRDAKGLVPAARERKVTEDEKEIYGGASPKVLSGKIYSFGAK